MIILYNIYNVKKRDLDNFVIYNNRSHIVIQFDISEEIAQRNTMVINDHEEKNSRKRIFRYVSLERVNIDEL